jgi:hypothetical protein
MVGCYVGVLRAVASVTRGGKIGFVMVNNEIDKSLDCCLFKKLKVLIRKARTS